MAAPVEWKGEQSPRILREIIRTEKKERVKVENNIKN
jgi:hypothetical protein